MVFGVNLENKRATCRTPEDGTEAVPPLGRTSVFSHDWRVGIRPHRLIFRVLQVAQELTESGCSAMLRFALPDRRRTIRPCANDWESRLLRA